MHRAGAALSMIAALLRSGESHGLADAIEKCRAWIDPELIIVAIDAQRDLDFAPNIRPIRVCCGCTGWLGRACRRCSCRFAHGGFALGWKKCPTGLVRQWIVCHKAPFDCGNQWYSTPPAFSVSPSDDDAQWGM